MESETKQSHGMLKKCPTCSAQMKVWKHRLTPGLVRLLLKFVKGIRRKGINDVHIQKELELTRSEDANFQKLRYFGLVAKVKDDTGRHIGGHWLITKRGGAFLKDQEAVSVWVKTWRNHIEERSEEKVTLSNFWSRIREIDPQWYVEPQWYFQQDFTFELHDIES